jgi:molybdopterin converting factor small subunit
MEIKVRLFATLRENRGKEMMLLVEDAAPVSQVIMKLGIEDKDIAILLVNGLNAPQDRILSEGDIVSIFPPVGGG